MVYIYFQDSPKHESTSRDRQMVHAERKKVLCLIKRKTFKVFNKRITFPATYFLPDTYVSTIRENEGFKKFDARYVIGERRAKSFILQQSQNLQPPSIRIVHIVAAVFDYDVSAADLQQAYLQSNSILTKPVSIKIRPAELKFLLERDLKLLNPLYGLRVK